MCSINFRNVAGEWILGTCSATDMIVKCHNRNNTASCDNVDANFNNRIKHNSNARHTDTHVTSAS